jgi:hypothetical protein
VAALAGATPPRAGSTSDQAGDAEIQALGVHQRLVPGVP